MDNFLTVDYGVTALDGVPIVSSRKIADIFEKRHDNVLQDVDNLDCSQEFTALNFQESRYKDSTGKKNREYLMTKDGFTFLVMGYRGKRAAQFKESYINRFNEMEKFIQSRNIARLEYPELTNAIKLAHQEPKFYHYSNEADMINRIVLGMSAKKFKEKHSLDKDASIREYLDSWQLEAIQKLQRFDVGLVMTMPEFEQRKSILQTFFNALSLQIDGATLKKLIAN